MVFLNYYEYLLGNFEGERKVVAAFVGRELGVVEGVRQEVVHQRAERQPVRPARGEVLQLHILQVVNCVVDRGVSWGKVNIRNSE